MVLDGSGLQQEIFKLPAEDLERDLRLQRTATSACLAPEKRILPDRTDPKATTGRLVLSDIYHGRNMDGIPRGQIKKLLVLETLPMPVHFSGSMEPISYGGTFTLVRILGTVPVEPDGSAYMELPALRSLFFVALDEQDLSVKRMQSFLTVQPGETTGCVGCHEQRTQSARTLKDTVGYAAMRRPPSTIEPIAGVPEVLDFPRDIQPILDQLCVSCHGYEKTTAGGPRAGRVILTGDRGPIYSHSYYALTAANLFSDGRNQPRSNYAPRRLGSAASRLLQLARRLPLRREGRPASEDNAPALDRDGRGLSWNLRRPRQRHDRRLPRGTADRHGRRLARRQGRRRRRRPAMHPLPRFRQPPTAR